MATVQTIIDNARYDLGDFGGQKYDDVQMLHYMNRIVPIVDDILIALDSDFTKTSAAVTLSSGANTATLPTRCDHILKIWYGSDLLLKESLDVLMYRYQINNASSTTGLPSYWAHNATNIYFNIEADQDYALTAYYHVRTATLAVTDNMPFNDVFNEFFREAIVSMAQKAKDNQITPVDQQFYSTFKHIAERYVISRNKNLKKYWKDF